MAWMKFCGRLRDFGEKILSFFIKCYCTNAQHFSTFGQIPSGSNTAPDVDPPFFPVTAYYGLKLYVPISP